eukprot:JP446086.1.p1 GENE.JP446086.1~~JP446086.1.p1  ORF type:complete len:379 (+),score=39.96 JP446086.1:76-1212(+)
MKSVLLLLAVLVGLFPCCWTQIAWTTGTPMPSFLEKSGAAAVGNMVHIINVNTHLKYNVDTGVWAAATPQPKNQRLSSALSAVGTDVFLMSGFAPGQGFFSNNEKYNSVADTWMTVTATPIAQEFPFSATDGVSKIWITGGWTGGPTSSLHHEYDVSSDAFVAKAPVPTAQCCAGSAYADGYVVAVGGQAGRGFLVEVYNIDADVWTTGTSSPSNRENIFGGSNSLGARVFALGGTSGTTSFDRYDPAADEWVSLEPLPAGHAWGSLAITSGGFAVALGSQPGGLSVHVANVFTAAELQGDPELTSFGGRRFHALLFPGVFTLFSSKTLTVNVLVDNHPMLPPDENLVVMSVGYSAGSSKGFCSASFRWFQSVLLPTS